MSRNDRSLVPMLAVAALLAGLLAMLALPGQGLAKRNARASRAPAGQFRGVNLTPFEAFIPGGQSDADNQREVQSACQIRADTVRVFVAWSLLEPSPGQVSADYASKLDDLVNRASSCGARVMFDLVTTPAWDTTAPAGVPWTKWGSYPPGAASDFGWIVRWILQRWPSLLTLEVWNEPNYQPYWYGTPAQYAGLVNAAVAAKHEVGSGTQILAGALASGNVDSLIDYLGRLYAAGMNGQDGISIHPYSMYCSDACSLTSPSPSRGPFRAAVTRTHELMVQRGDGGGLWLTEFGFASCPAAPTCVPEGTQAQWMVKSIRLASCYPYVRAVTPFTVRDIPGDPQYSQVFDAHFGLLRTDFSAKPAFSAVASVYRGLHTGRGYAARAARRGRHSRRGRASSARTSACRRLLRS